MAVAVPAACVGAVAPNPPPSVGAVVVVVGAVVVVAEAGAGGVVVGLLNKPPMAGVEEELAVGVFTFPKNGAAAGAVVVAAPVAVEVVEVVFPNRGGAAGVVEVAVVVDGAVVVTVLPNRLDGGFATGVELPRDGVVAGAEVVAKKRTSVKISQLTKRSPYQAFRTERAPPGDL